MDKIKQSVDLNLKANVYFDGKVVSFNFTENNQKKSAGIMFPGSYTFNTGAPEVMVINFGDCSYRPKNSDSWIQVKAGEQFQVEGDSSFDIKIDAEPVHYVCEYA